MNISNINEKKIQFISQSIRHRNDVAAAYLFGSFAKEPVYNDIDILILYDKQYSHQYSDFEITQLIAEALGISAEKIDLLPFDLNKVNPLVLEQLVRAY